MHDIDRTTLELEEGEFDPETFGEGGFGSESGELGFLDELAGPFSEAEELELATELMNISSEEELDQFLGNVFKKAWRGIKKVGSTVGKIARPLGGVLKGLAKTALPFVGGALGSFIPIPGVGTAVGSALGGALSKALEMEGVSPDDREFEMARRFVRVAGTAARNAAGRGVQSNPRAAAKAVVMSALKQHVPNFNVESVVPAAGRRISGHSGRWFRSGHSIILTGV